MLRVTNVPVQITSFWGQTTKRAFRTALRLSSSARRHSSVSLTIGSVTNRTIAVTTATNRMIVRSFPANQVSSSAITTNVLVQARFATARISVETTRTRRIATTMNVSVHSSSAVGRVRRMHSAWMGISVVMELRTVRTERTNMAAK